MQKSTFLIEPVEAEALLDDNNLVIIDLGKPETYTHHHLPGAVHLNYAHIIKGTLPAPGALPSFEHLQSLINALGITPETHVLVYDDEGNAKACRFLWTLDSISHQHYSLLNGGIHSWVNEGHRLSRKAHRPNPKSGEIKLSDTPQANKEYIKNILDNPATILLDTRTEAEYSGQRGGLRMGHIPGAIHFNWLDAIDRNNNMRFLPDTALNSKFDHLGLRRDKEIITYCQTNLRASHTHRVLKHLGYPNLKGYAGSWAEWGSDVSLPIA